MADVNLVYDPAAGTFHADPPRIKVKRGDTINFKHATAVTNGVPLITFRHPNFFSTDMLLGEGSVQVKHDVTPTSFHCVLFVGGVPVARSSEDGANGGAIDPADN